MSVLLEFRWRKQLDSHLIVKRSSILSFDSSDDCALSNFIQELRTQLDIYLSVRRSSLALVDRIACDEDLDTTSDSIWNEVAIMKQFDRQTLSRLFFVDKQISSFSFNRSGLIHDLINSFYFHHHFIIDRNQFEELLKSLTIKDEWRWLNIWMINYLNVHLTLIHLALTTSAEHSNDQSFECSSDVDSIRTNDFSWTFR